MNGHVNTFLCILLNTGVCLRKSGRFDTSFLTDCREPKLFICADNDFAASIEEVEKGMLNASEPKILDVIESCDHFYIDKEHNVANKVYEFFTSNSST